MNKYFLGIDGGGTKTALCLIDENFNIVDIASSGPGSYDTVSQEVFKENVIKALNKLKFNGKIVSVFAGLGGICNKEDSLVVSNTLKSINELKDAIIEVDNDVVNAYYSAFGDEFGIVCIIGTGSVAYGVNGNIIHRCGGYCYQEGDAGSSYDLGRKALQYYARVIDKRLPETDFSAAIGKEINIYSFDKLAHFFVSSSRTEVAQIAKVVTKYQHNDVARKIISDAVDEVVLMINTVYRECGFNDASFSVIGSLGNVDTLYRKLLLERVKIKYVEPKFEAYLGSSIKALINYKRRF